MKSKFVIARGNSSLGGKSIGLTLPIEYIRKLKWRERQKVVVNLRGQKITIEDWKK